MARLPHIFHSDRIVSNNRNSFNTFNSYNDELIPRKEIKKEEYTSSFDKDSLINYFNRSISLTLKDGRVVSGVLISKRGDIILLDTGEFINVDSIISVN